MRKFRLLTILTIVSFSTFSQSLKPTVHKAEGDTLFCFTITQTREIAKRIVKAQYADSIIAKLESESSLLRMAVLEKDSIVLLAEVKNKVQESISSNQEQIILYQTREIEEKERQIKRMRRHKVLLSTLLTVVTVLAVL